jgi:molybdenum-dependent DNA-binding transcriptional regulator ModE
LLSVTPFILPSTAGSHRRGQDNPLQALHDHDASGDEDVNEVKTFAKAGETAGAAVGTGVQTVREGATRARRQLAEQVSEHGTVGRAARDAGASAQTALADRWGTLQDNFPERWETAQEQLSGRMTGARRELAARLEPARHELAARLEPAAHELAARLEPAAHELAARLEPAPPPRRSRRWPWLLLLLASLGCAAAAVVLAQRPQPIDSSGAVQPTPPLPQDPAAPHGNGAVTDENSTT